MTHAGVAEVSCDGLARLGRGHPLTLAMLADAFVADDIPTISAKRPIWWPHSPPTTGRANNGGTEAINGLIELHRRIARDFTNRENYRLRMLLIGGGLDQTHRR